MPICRIPQFRIATSLRIGVAESYMLQEFGNMRNSAIVRNVLLPNRLRWCRLRCDLS